MKKVLYLITIAILVLQTTTVGAVYGLNTGFSTDIVDESSQQKYLKNIELSVFYVEPDKGSIECFDVSSDGLVALGSSFLLNKTVCIYDSFGKFIYGYKFKNLGDFCVEWDEEDLNIYFIRSDYILSFDSSGKCQGFCEVQNTLENDYYYRNFIDANKKEIGNRTYVLKNNNGVFDQHATRHSSLVVIDEYGAAEVIYKSDNKRTIKLLLILLITCLLLVLVYGVKSIKLKTGDGSLSSNEK